MLALGPKQLSRVVCLVYVSPDDGHRKPLPQEIGHLAKDQVAYVSDSIVRRDDTFVDTVDLWSPRPNITSRPTSLLPSPEHILLEHDLEAGRDLARLLPMAKLWIWNGRVWVVDDRVISARAGLTFISETRTSFWQNAFESQFRISKTPAITHALLLAAQHVDLQDADAEILATWVIELCHRFVESLPADMRPPEFWPAWDPEWRLRTLHKLRRHPRPIAPVDLSKITTGAPRNIADSDAITLPPTSYLYDDPLLLFAPPRNFQVRHALPDGRWVTVAVALLDADSTKFRIPNLEDCPVLLWFESSFSLEWVGDINWLFSKYEKIVLHLGHVLSRSQIWKTNFVLTSWNINDTLQWMCETYDSSRIIILEYASHDRTSSHSYSIASHDRTSSHSYSIAQLAKNGGHSDFVLSYTQAITAAKPGARNAFVPPDPPQSLVGQNVSDVVAPPPGEITSRRDDVIQPTHDSPPQTYDTMLQSSSNENAWLPNPENKTSDHPERQPVSEIGSQILVPAASDGAGIDYAKNTNSTVTIPTQLSLGESLDFQDKTTLVYFATQYCSSQVPVDHFYTKKITLSFESYIGTLRSLFDIACDPKNMGTGRFAWAKKQLDKYEYEIMSIHEPRYPKYSLESKQTCRALAIRGDGKQDLTQDHKYQFYSQKDTTTVEKIKQYRERLSKKWFGSSEALDYEKLRNSDNPKAKWMANYMQPEINKRYQKAYRHIHSRARTHVIVPVASISRTLDFSQQAAQVKYFDAENAEHTPLRKWLFENGMNRFCFEHILEGGSMPKSPYAPTIRRHLEGYFARYSLPRKILDIDTDQESIFALMDKEFPETYTESCHAIHSPIWVALPSRDTFSTKKAFLDYHRGVRPQVFDLASEFTKSNTKSRRDFAHVMAVIGFDSDPIVKHVLHKLKFCTPAADSFLVGQDTTLVLEKYIKNLSGDGDIIDDFKAVLESNNTSWRSPEHFFHSMWPSIRDHKFLRPMVWLLLNGPGREIFLQLIKNFPFLPETYSNTDNIVKVDLIVKSLLDMYKNVAEKHPTCLAGAFEMSVYFGNWVLAIYNFANQNYVTRIYKNTSRTTLGPASASTKSIDDRLKGLPSDANYDSFNDKLPVHPAKKLAEVYRNLHDVSFAAIDHVQVDFLTYRNHLFEVLRGVRPDVSKLCAMILGSGFSEWAAFGDVNRFAGNFIYGPFDRTVVNRLQGRPFNYDTGVFAPCTWLPTEQVRPKYSHTSMLEIANLSILESQYGSWVKDFGMGNQIATDLLAFLDYFQRMWQSQSYMWTKIEYLSEKFQKLPDNYTDYTNQEPLLDAVVLCARAAYTYYNMAKECRQGTIPNSTQWHIYAAELSASINEDVAAIIDQVSYDNEEKNFLFESGLSANRVLVRHDVTKYIASATPVASRPSRMKTTVRKVELSAKLTTTFFQNDQASIVVDVSVPAEASIVYAICDMTIDDLTDYMDFFNPRLKAPNAIVYWDMVAEIADVDDKSDSKILDNKGRLEVCKTRYAERVFRIVTGLDPKMVIQNAHIKESKQQLEEMTKQDETIQQYAFRESKQHPVRELFAAIIVFSESTNSVDDFVTAVSAYLEEESKSLAKFSHLEIIKKAKKLVSDHGNYVQEIDGNCQQFQKLLRTYYGVDGVEMGDFFDPKFRFDVFRLYVYLLTTKYKKYDNLQYDLQLSLDPLYILKRYRSLCRLYPMDSCDCTRDLITRILPTYERPVVLAQNEIPLYAKFVEDLLSVVNGYLKYHGHKVYDMQPPRVSTQAEAKAYIHVLENHLQVVCKTKIVDLYNHCRKEIRVNNYLSTNPIVRYEQYKCLFELDWYGQNNLDTIVENFYVRYDWTRVNSQTRIVYAFLMARLAAKCNLQDQSLFPGLRCSWLGMQLTYIKDPISGQTTETIRESVIHYHYQKSSMTPPSDRSSSLTLQTRTLAVKTIMAINNDIQQLRKFMDYRPVRRRWAARALKLGKQLPQDEARRSAHTNHVRLKTSWLFFARPYVVCIVQDDVVHSLSEFLEKNIPRTTLIAAGSLMRAYGHVADNKRVIDAAFTIPPVLSVYDKIEDVKNIYSINYQSLEEAFGQWAHVGPEADTLLQVVVRGLAGREARKPKELRTMLCQFFKAYNASHDWVVLWMCDLLCNIAVQGVEDYKNEFEIFGEGHFRQKFKASKDLWTKGSAKCAHSTADQCLDIKRGVGWNSELVRSILYAFFDGEDNDLNGLIQNYRRVKNF